MLADAYETHSRKRPGFVLAKLTGLRNAFVCMWRDEMALLPVCKDMRIRLIPISILIVVIIHYAEDNLTYFWFQQDHVPSGGNEVSPKMADVASERRVDAVI